MEISHLLTDMSPNLIDSPGKDLWKANDVWSLELKEMCLSEIYMKVIWLIAILLHCTRILLIYRAFFSSLPPKHR